MLKTIDGIRQGTLEDIDAIGKLVEEFKEESLGKYPLSFKWETIRKKIETFIKYHIVIIAERNKMIIGVAIGMVTSSMFDENQKIGQEFMWYVSKNERKGSIGLRLSKEFEKEAKKRGANLILMAYMGNLYSEVLDRFYKINGYKLMETQYIKGV